MRPLPRGRSTGVYPGRRGDCLRLYDDFPLEVCRSPNVNETRKPLLSFAWGNPYLSNYCTWAKERPMPGCLDVLRYLTGCREPHLHYSFSCKNRYYGSFNLLIQFLARLSCDFGWQDPDQD